VYPSVERMGRGVWVGGGGGRGSYTSWCLGSRRFHQSCSHPGGGSDSQVGRASLPDTEKRWSEYEHPPCRGESWVPCRGESWLLSLRCARRNALRTDRAERRLWTLSQEQESVMGPVWGPCGAHGACGGGCGRWLIVAGRASLRTVTSCCDNVETVLN